MTIYITKIYPPMSRNCLFSVYTCMYFGENSNYMLTVGNVMCHFTLEEKYQGCPSD